MNSTRVSALLLCLCLTAVVGGCRAGGQVYEVKDAPIEAGKPLTLDQVQKAIIDAGIKQTWIMTQPREDEPILSRGRTSKVLSGILSQGIQLL